MYSLQVTTVYLWHALLSAVLGTAGLSGMELILVGGFLMGAWSAISPAIGQSLYF